MSRWIGAPKYFVEAGKGQNVVVFWTFLNNLISKFALINQWLNAWKMQILDSPFCQILSIIISSRIEITAV